jgi:hypothetical protein
MHRDNWWMGIRIIYSNGLLVRTINDFEVAFR